MKELCHLTIRDPCSGNIPQIDNPSSYVYMYFARAATLTLYKRTLFIRTQTQSLCLLMIKDQSKFFPVIILVRIVHIYIRICEGQILKTPFPSDTRLASNNDWSHSKCFAILPLAYSDPLEIAP